MRTHARVQLLCVFSAMSTYTSHTSPSFCPGRYENAIAHSIRAAHACSSLHDKIARSTAAFCLIHLGAVCQDVHLHRARRIDREVARDEDSAPEAAPCVESAGLAASVQGMKRVPERCADGPAPVEMSEQCRVRGGRQQRLHDDSSCMTNG